MEFGIKSSAIYIQEVIHYRYALNSYLVSAGTQSSYKREIKYRKLSLMARNAFLLLTFKVIKNCVEMVSLPPFDVTALL